MTIIREAKAGTITEEMKTVARQEGVEVELIREGIARGTIVIPFNRRHKNLIPRGIGTGLSTKVNANLGTSDENSDQELEMEKLKVALESGADAVMDLSTGDRLSQTRSRVISESQVPVGTVPIYQTAAEAQQTKKAIVDITVDDIFNTIIEQAEDGVDFITVHCGLTVSGIAQIKKEGRVLDIVSRGGALLTGWMVYNNCENPLYEYYDHLLEIASDYDLTLSLGDGLRPGSLADATDRGQIQELLVLGELVDRAREEEVQVIVEGPGHVPFNQIEANVQLEKRLCHGAPFYVLGPLVTDITPGYDHISAAIGGTLAAQAGADFLCYVTPAEHLGLPTVEEVKEGVIAARIAAHAADLAGGNKRALQRDLEMSRARKELDWEGQIELAIDPGRAKLLRDERNPSKREVCSMCGELCAIRMASQALNMNNQ